MPFSSGTVFHSGQKCCPIEPWRTARKPAVFKGTRIRRKQGHKLPRGPGFPKIANYASLVEFGVFGFGLEEDGDVGVGVFPGSEEILIGGAGLSGITL